VTAQIRSQDAVSLIVNVALNPVGRSIAWDWLRTNWDTLLDRFGSSMSFSSLILGVTSHFFTAQQLADGLLCLLPLSIDRHSCMYLPAVICAVNSFFSSRTSLGSASRAVQQSQAAIQRNIDWLATNYGPVMQWLVNPN
jgi:glutamyl aminopeptidase